MFEIIQRHSYGPGLKNPLKGTRGRWSTDVYKTREGETIMGLYGHPVTARTFTTVPSGTRPHQSDREISRRLRQAERKAA